MNKVLMVAFHFPPMAVSSGTQRTLKFANYLLEYGWEATVLTATGTAYLTKREDQLGAIDPRVKVTRAWALDAARHLSIRGKYPDFLANPDRWSTWIPSALISGLGRVLIHRPQIIWSTFPIAGAHVIGRMLHDLTGIPWVADFRDPMIDVDYPDTTTVRVRYRRIEATTVKKASRIVLTTPGAVRELSSRFPEVSREKFVCIRNGYDESSYRSRRPPCAPVSQARPLHLVHSGLLYPSERDPRCFFEAISRLRSAGLVNADNLRVTLRATGHDDCHRTSIEQLGIGDIVELQPDVPYEEALDEMQHADGLIVFQASNCNNQVPAKVYEYFRAERPILALTDPSGDTADTLRHAGVDTIADLHSSDSIVDVATRFIESLRSGTSYIVPDTVYNAYSRKALSKELADLFGHASGE